MIHRGTRPDQLLPGHPESLQTTADPGELDPPRPDPRGSDRNQEQQEGPLEFEQALAGFGIQGMCISSSF